jgi:molybdopterin synthase catalytic subunit
VLETWVKEVKETTDPASLGMILVHDGVVRGTSKTGERIGGMRLSYDRQKLGRVVNELRTREGIVDIRVWINSGELKVGDDIMLLLVAGRLRTDVLPVFEELLSTVKKDIVKETEIDESPR